MSQGIASILSTSSDTAQLRLQAGDGGEVDNEIIQQFEAIFLQQMLKSMRTASLAEGLFQSDQSEFYRDMYDQQIATNLAQKEILGIAQIINRQLGGESVSQVSENNDEKPVQGIQLKHEDIAPIINADKNYSSSIDTSKLDRFIDNLSASVHVDSEETANVTKEVRPLAFKPDTPDEFVQVAYRYAQEPAEKLGVDPDVLIAIAALETGWGNHIPQDGKGSSNNYFGIKADSRWDGDLVGSQTLEFDQGAFKELKQSFRAYDSIKESFDDYANFILTNDRYSYALEFASDAKKFLSEIQNAGYATDPNYADKILNVLSNKAFSLSR